MNKKVLKKGAAIVLSTCMIVNASPLSQFQLTSFASENIIDFTDENNRGSWNKVLGNGTIEFQDGIAENGFMLLKGDGHTVFADTGTELLKNGFVEMDLTSLNESRIAILFRYKSSEDWQGIGVDQGKWIWFKGKDRFGDLTSKKKSFTQKGESHKIRIEYYGKNIRVLEDGVEIINQDVEAFDESSEGNIGIRLWGEKFANGTDTNGHVKIDNIKTGSLEKVTISPSEIQIPYNEVGKKDYEIELQNLDTELNEIRNGDSILEPNKDYVLQDNILTIKREFIESIKKLEISELILEFENGQNIPLSISIEQEDEVVSYSRNFKDGIEGFEKVSGVGSMTHDKESGELVIQDDGLFIDNNSKKLKNQEVEFTYDPKNNNCGYGVVLRYNSPTDYLYVGPSQQHNQHYTSWGIYGPNGKIASIQDSGFILAGRDVPYKVKVRVIDKTVTIFVDNEEIYNGTVDITTKAGKVGFKTVNNTGMMIQEMKQETAIAPKLVDNVKSREIKSKDMTVRMDPEFPRVIDYTLKSKTVVKGQELPIHQLEINNKLYTPKVTSKFFKDRVVYHVSVDEIGISFNVEFEVEDNILSMKIKNVKEKKTKLYTLNFPGHSLVSMSSNDENAELRINNYREETKIPLNNAKASKAYGETTLAVLSNKKAAAAISGTSYKNRHEIAYQTFDAGDHTSTGLWMNEYTYRGLDGEKMYDPWTKVSITEDRNSDGKVDYQDGAIALRDDCMEEKVGADIATDSWNMIAMNVGSEAQYPFLRILDNAKKMSLATDNFQQNIIIKGYQSEGHDASHPDFANYNKRAGGLEDFNTLLENSEKYNTKIGVHINHTDVYPEAPQYDALKTSLGAWSWYDSALQIVRENDGLNKSNDGLDGRLKQLYDKDTGKKLDTTYVDVFFGTRWPMYKLVDNINGKNRNMALATEYVDEMVSYSVFAHHIGSNFGGEGNLVRFVNNNQADIFANHKLFRGANSRANDDVGINGWQTAKNMNNALQAFYEKILPNKFLAQYKVMQYENDNKAVLGENGEVVTEMKNGVNVITKDNKVIADGNKIFIPWESNEKKKEEKIYHWNREGGTTEWELPNSWGKVSSVKLYELSDKGKQNPVTVKVKNGKVQINAKAKTGYVLYKKDAKKIETAATIDWSTGSPVKDMGFDSHNFDIWKKSSSSKTTEHIQIENNELGNSHLFIKGKNDGKVTQKITGLKKGQTYSASVWCITDDGRKASIEVKNGEEVVSNYMNRSNVTYGIHHNDKYKTKAQRMQVRFTATSDTAILSLSAEEGNSSDSVVDFDDVRVVKVDKSTNPQPEKYTYWEDFENTDQGYGAFVSTESDQSHLSQKNPINPEATPDVIDGNYSLKVRAGDYMRTIPSTVRLEPESEYVVGIDYKSPSANAFTLAVKSDKAREAGDEDNAVIASTVAKDKEGNLILKFETGNYDDYYIDITKKGGTEYYLDNFYVESSKPINRETLGKLIDEAKSLNQNDYTPESYEKLKIAISEAQLVFEDANSTKESIREAYKNLEAKIESLIAYATSEDKEKLKQVITEMKSINKSDYKEDEKWIRFQTVIGEADKLVSSQLATKPEITEMIRLLSSSKDLLSPNVDRTDLHNIIKKSERVERNTIVDGAELQTFLSSLEDAKNIDLKQGVTEDEVLKATQSLTDAYNKIILKTDSKNELVSNALKKSEVKETYFLEEDLKNILEAKDSFNKMKNQESVLVKDYFINFDKLNDALSNKLSRPVISSSIKIPSNNFIINTNTQQAASGNEGPVRFAFDENPATYWHSAWSGFTVSPNNPAIVTVDMKDSYSINQFSYLQRPQGGNNGKIQKYNLYVRGNNTEESEWKKVITDGTFKDLDGIQNVSFDTVDARYIKIEVTQGVGNFASAAEFAFYERGSDFSKLQKVMNDFEKLDKDLYTKSSYESVSSLYKEAENIIENLLSDQNEINILANNIEKAINELEEIADSIDILSLKNAIVSAEKINPSDYENSQLFEDALKDAKNIISKAERQEEVTKKELTSALMTLISEQNNLVK